MGVVAIALRVLEAHASRCNSLMRATLWLGGGGGGAGVGASGAAGGGTRGGLKVNAAAVAVAVASSSMTSPANGAPGTAPAPAPVAPDGLMRALETLLASERLEQHPTLAKHGVHALCALSRLLLRFPELVSQQEKGGEEDEQDEEDEEDLAEVGDDDANAETSATQAQPEDVEHNSGGVAGASDGKEHKTPKDEAKQKDTEAADEGVEAKDTAKPNEDTKNADTKQNDSDREEDSEDEKDEEKENDGLEDDAAGNELEGSRVSGPSLFEKVQEQQPEEGVARTSTGTDGTTDVIAASAPVNVEMGAPQEEVAATAPDGDAARRSRVLWLAVRLSHHARSFLAKPSHHFVRLMSIFRFFTALADSLPAGVLEPLLVPMLSPAYRCTSGFTAGYDSQLPDVQTLEQAINLSTSQRVEFLAQLAQMCMDTLSRQMQSAGRGARFAKALGHVRKAVEQKRADRAQKRKLQPIADPQAAAQAKRTKNRLKQASKKRKMEELIIKKHGGASKTRVKLDARSLV